MSLIDTLLIDGTDIQTYARIVEDFSGVLDVAPRRGSNYRIPGRDGELYVAKPRDVLPVSLGLAILPTTGDGVEPATEQLRTAQLWVNYKALVALCKADTGGTVTLTRKLSTAAGSYTSETCTAECSGGMSPTLIGSEVMRVVLEFVNLDGTWT